MRYVIVISLLASLTIFFSRCLNTGFAEDPRGEEYAGSNTCVSCHRDISNSYAHTSHYKTSAAIDNDQLKRLITQAKDNDRFYFGDSSYVRVEEGQNALFQNYFVDNKKNTTAKFDIAFGSGEKAQTYAYWKNDQLFELPLTWFTATGTWANSPGFSARHAHYGRTITSRCFECHASNVSRELVQSGPLSVTEKLDANSIVYGIDCQRCHGPAARHVKFQQDNPGVKTAKYIIPIRSLSRQRELDVCGVCHSGNDLSPQRSLFTFTPGDTLSHFYYPEFASENHEPDVHGKQVQLLMSSLCFRKSDMTCTTCHAPHQTETNRITAFITKCMDCHANSAHAKNILKDNEQKKRDFNLVGTNCIDCHMPLQTSKTIYFNNGTESKNIPYLIRTHKIAIYK